MSDRDAERDEEAADPPANADDAPGASPPPRLRRGLFGYRRSDVEGALSTRADELAELRQDVAALWLAFAQHDRMIRESIEPPLPAAPPAAPLEPDRTPPPPPPPPTAGAQPSVGSELSDLDDVLSAIEKATNTLERTYAEEIAASPTPEGTTAPEGTDRDAQADEGAAEGPGSSGSSEPGPDERT